MKIDTIDKFVKYIDGLIKADGSFILYTNKDKGFEHLDDGEIALVGETDTEIFAFKVIKVDY